MGGASGEWEEPQASGRSLWQVGGASGEWEEPLANGRSLR